MMVHSIIASNFGSYEYVAFEPDNKGLCLIHGATGCGKSTIPDMVSWGLFGTTAKNGNADDVRSWSNLGESTSVSIVVTAKDGSIITVNRTRGPGDNDLYWTEGENTDVEYRGKNITETQRLLDGRLQINDALFSIASYSSEASHTSSFFLSSAKTRRELLEQLVDLSLPTRVESRIAEDKKKLRADLKPLQTNIDRTIGAIDQNRAHLRRLIKQASEWDTNQAHLVKVEQTKATKFEELKASKIHALETRAQAFSDAHHRALGAMTEKIIATYQKLEKAEANHVECAACGTLKGAEEVATLKGALKHLKTLQLQEMATPNPHLASLDYARKEQNTSHDRLADLLEQKNPHTRYIEDTKEKVLKQDSDLLSLQEKVKAINTRITLLDQLYNISFDLRGSLLQNAVKTLEETTNRNLETYFESEFRVAFTLDGGDALDVAITKGGYDCVYRQLSKGQKQLLKLCFTVGVMDIAANTAGIHFDQLFFDEALDGLDSTLKVKAFSLFEKLSQTHGSVFVIEHSPEFQEMCTNKWKVTLKGELSELDTNG